MQGLLLINKPEGLTSFGVVAKIKWLLHTKRVGHTGTLDPMATGVLPVLVGRDTVLCSHLLDADKEYVASVKLGVTTDTLDKTGRVLSTAKVKVSKEELENTLKGFSGKQLQVPPMYSALKRDGVRLYDLAREGKEVEREPREIEIFELELLDFNGDEFKIRVLCSKGTYIRSLADDIGKKLGVGATLTGLIRTKTAGFSLDECVDLDSLTPENVTSFLKSSENAVLNYPLIAVSEKQAQRFSNGGELSLERLHFKTAPQNGEIYRVKNGERFLGLGEVDISKSALKIKCLTYHPSDAEPKEGKCNMPEYSVALGTFDGLHLGHKAVLGSIIKNGLTPVALTFNVPPKFNNKTNLLITPDEKINRLKKLGISAKVLDFNSVKNLSPDEFLSFIKAEFSPKIIATGYDFRFGKGALGTIGDLAEFCKANGILYSLADAVNYGGEPISSSRIRSLIQNGEIKTANKMLGESFCFSGEVAHGDERGRTMGFPTLNIPYPTELVTPKFGVYASITEIGGRLYKSVTDIGVRPTFKTDYVISETNIMDFGGEVYGKKATVYLVDYIRGEVKFSGIDELKDAILSDKKIAAKILENEEI